MSCQDWGLRVVTGLGGSAGGTGPGTAGCPPQIIMVRLQRVTFLALHNYLGLTTELFNPVSAASCPCPCHVTGTLGFERGLCGRVYSSALKPVLVDELDSPEALC